MQKELNPEIFGERRAARTTPAETIPVGLPETAGFLNVDRQILELRNQVLMVGEELKKMAAQAQEFMKVSHLKLERLQQQVHRLEQSHNGLVQETGHKISQMGHRLAERKALDSKIQEMVDRHTNVIKSFEVRMNHLQRLLSEKEAQVVGAQAALNEAKMELSRLKRL
ncbi:MAG: hypothetical protein KF802_06580 [Bdellovibrionaceae bacterium]|nr:hypothetical protein [Pseudobdellovibrionaceae bacterium]MBX3034428.1 hypothetical protein [Pseudobdellovibrionaceae bacterium]